MGHKVNPKIFRMGIIRSWDSKWFAKKNFSDFLRQDILIRKFLKKQLREASLDKIEIERSGDSVKVIIFSGKPGIIIGRSGAGIEELKNKLKKLLNKIGLPNINLNLNIQEVSNPSLSANIILHNIIDDIEKRIPFRRVLRQAVAKAEKAGAKGVKVMVSGRLNGAEIARTEKLISGKIPLHTLRADIDYTRGTANTIYGAIGVKVWIYKGEIFK
ncbi:30S ribosomal protein S3 [Candidatus Falkowbacteria bacterium RBG_13_39_14]|uniref:Small ribosomal subunit protein uS3 n=1 Tax=Candidatus Falkowbacteria bacterium RBG_13_39_14 TaxID=1797985 RepID=A0A1F5S3I8_9BACT|nr:MAG: 30S ribosomal protein S3 [Candidatus Falkowbacteria bacterium RBG_13_39_14]